jgi:hypothetical protein
MQRCIDSVFFLLSLIFMIFIAHHAVIYLHEWTHGTFAWITGYKNSPFDIHYGERWLTLLDIDEAVPYKKIFEDGKPAVVALIAIAPTVLQAIVFLLGLKLLSIQMIQTRKWLFTFLYWFILLELGEFYAYIPIRTFSESGDIFNFRSATGLSPWMIAIPGTLFVIWGIYRFLTVEEPKACSLLNITSKYGHFFFLLGTLVLFFGYYGGAGLLMPDVLSRTLSYISWGMIPIILLLMYQKASNDSNSG